MAQEQTTEQDLNELENRLERLRVLYEQYFMGLEKREPGVARKDVERRMQLLRKVRFPSTAVRFRFQTTVQRYNTLQQYWNRTCREIDAGTYRRHVLRAEKRFLADALPSDQPLEGDDKDRKERGAEVRARAADDLSTLLDSDVDLDAEMKGVLASLEKPPTDPPTTLGKLGKRTDPVKAPVSPPLQLGKLPEIKTKQAPAQPSIHPGRALSPKPKGLEPLAPRTTTANPAAAREKAVPPLQPLAIPAPTITEKKGPPPAPSMQPKPLLQPKPVPQPSPSLQPRPVPQPSPSLQPRPVPQPSPSLQPRPAPQPKPALQPSPLPQPKPAPRPSPALQANRAPSSSGLSVDRIQALHASYVEARKKTNASAVSYEKLERNLRETEKKLRETHKGKHVDFEVAIKDGKAILKPRLR